MKNCIYLQPRVGSRKVRYHGIFAERDFSETSLRDETSRETKVSQDEDVVCLTRLALLSTYNTYLNLNLECFGCV